MKRSQAFDQVDHARTGVQVHDVDRKQQSDRVDALGRNHPEPVVAL
jgi:hypothetical protein